MKNNKLVIIIIFAINSIIILSCKNNEKHILEEGVITESSNNTDSQRLKGFNVLVDDPENEGEKMLLGLVNQDGFKNEGYFPWMYEGFETYKPSATKIQEINKLLDDVQLQIFMGTWCEDSQREIPRLYKILHTIDFNFSNMEIIALSHDKDTPSGLEKGYDIEYVPTIIFLKNGKELNRIVEYTQGKTLEDDILTILKNKPYRAAYTE